MEKDEEIGGEGGALTEMRMRRGKEWGGFLGQ